MNLYIYKYFPDIFKRCTLRYYHFEFSHFFKLLTNCCVLSCYVNITVVFLEPVVHNSLSGLVTTASACVKIYYFFFTICFCCASKPCFGLKRNEKVLNEVSVNVLYMRCNRSFEFCIIVVIAVLIRQKYSKLVYQHRRCVCICLHLPMLLLLLGCLADVARGIQMQISCTTHSKLNREN